MLIVLEVSFADNDDDDVGGDDDNDDDGGGRIIAGGGGGLKLFDFILSSLTSCSKSLLLILVSSLTISS